MRNIGFMLLVVAVVLGAAVVWGLRHMTASRAVASPHAGQTSVVVATRPIGFGETITPQLLRVQSWPQGAVPQGSFRTVAEATAQRRVALGPIAANEPVLTTRISGPGGRATLSGALREGMRASTIRVNDVFGVAGFVLPGDFVDVLVTRDEGGQGGQDSKMRTDVLLRGIRILAVDQLANDNKNDPIVAKAATVEVTPEQAQKLALAAQVGTLSLALRGTVNPLATDEEPQPITVRTGDLQLNRQAAPAPARRAARVASRRPANPAWSIQVTRGVESTVVHTAAPRSVG